MNAREALDTLHDAALDAFEKFAADLNPTDPDTFDALQAYAEQLADWLERSMAPIIEAARPKVLH